MLSAVTGASGLVGTAGLAGGPAAALLIGGIYLTSLFVRAKPPFDDSGKAGQDLSASDAPKITAVRQDFRSEEDHAGPEAKNPVQLDRLERAQKVALPARSISALAERYGGMDTAISVTIAYLLDLYLELKDPNWQTEIIRADDPRRSPRFFGNRPNLAALMSDLAPHMPQTPNASTNSTVRKHLREGIKLISDGWQSSTHYSGKQLPMAYRTLYGLCWAVIDASSIHPDSIWKGIQKPGKKAADQLQRIAHLPDQLTEEQLVDCLDACWSQFFLE